MRATTRCPKCGCSRIHRQQVEVIEKVLVWPPTFEPSGVPLIGPVLPGSTVHRVFWHEVYTCTDCGFMERYSLKAKPATPIPAGTIEAPTDGGPYR